VDIKHCDEILFGKIDETDMLYMSGNEIKKRIKAQDGWFYGLLYKLYRAIYSSNMPSVSAIYVPLRYERKIRQNAWRRVKSFLYYEPMFKTYCKSCGAHLSMLDDIPKIFGTPDIVCGSNVQFEGDSLIVAGKIAARPELIIRDGSYIGYHAQILIGNRIEIGSDVLIASNVFLAGYNSHPIDPEARARNEPPEEDGSGVITIEDRAWICNNATILKDVRIGEAAIVATGAVVTKDVAPYTMVAGNPARVVRHLEQKI
jgi:acetyltransferase-like isoleucine patch superfamily enzyme